MEAHNSCDLNAAVTSLLESLFTHTLQHYAIDICTKGLEKNQHNYQKEDENSERREQVREHSLKLA
jgi:hypothetical protein